MQDCPLRFVNTLTSESKIEPQIHSCLVLLLTVFVFSELCLSTTYGLAPGSYLFIMPGPHLSAVVVHTHKHPKFKIRSKEENPGRG